MTGSQEETRIPLVLVVDDDPAMRLLARATLEQNGYRIEEAENGEEALVMLEKMKPDLILLDVMMPKVDGFTVCARLRKMPVIDLVPVLMMTGLDDTESINRAYEAGATDFITKPVNWLILGHHVRYVLRASGAFEDLFKSEARNRALLNAMPDRMLRVDRDGMILESRGPDRADFLGHLAESRGKSVYEVIPAQIAQEIMHHTKAALESGQGQTFEGRQIVEGQRRYWETRIVKSGEEEALMIIRDVTERKETEESLRRSEERYALSSLAANDGLWDWDLKTGEIQFSPRWKSLLGYGEEEIGNSMKEWLDRVHPADVEKVKLEINAHLDGLTSHFENEHRMLHKDGTYRWMLTRGAAMRNEEGKPYRMAGSQSDISVRKRAEEQMLRDAFYDALTGLPNRTLLTDRLKHVLKRSRRPGDDHGFALLFIDLDRFKIVNDSLGHLMGDALLKETARRLEKCIRPGDTVARLGGDEFVLLSENIGNVDYAKTVADRIQKALSEPFIAGGVEIYTTASIGIALGSGEYQTPEDVLRDADITMYRAKALGKARYEVFDQSMRQQALSLLHMENDLRRAVENGEFQVYYQPIMGLASGAITSVEALARWHHPHRGLISPADFIPVAEETGLIVPIGEWVLRTACTQMKQWQSQGQGFFRVAVNVSAVQLRQQGFAEMAAAILHETGLNPDCLDLEITESVLMDRNRATVETLGKLKSLGIHLCLDDFGTGYSSLSYLQEFPVNVLKIDRSFVSKLAADPEKGKIVETILLLGKNLGMEVIAEGVETAEQLDRLKSIRCDHGQGYLFSRPVDHEAISAFMSALVKNASS